MSQEESSLPRYFVLIPCGGSGSRAGAGLPKQYRQIGGLPLVSHTLSSFAQVDGLAGGVVVIAPDDAAFDAQVQTTLSVARCAGQTRAQTVLNGIEWLLSNGAYRDDWVLVHDAARCLILPSQITALIEACRDDPVGGLLALPLADTLKVATNGRASITLDRSDKWLAQTPQMFRLGPLREALVAAGDAVTDEASAMELSGQQPRLVAASAQNFKVTYAADFALAEAILQSRQSKDKV